MKEQAAAQKAAIEAKKAKNLANGVIDDDEIVKMSYAKLRKGENPVRIASSLRKI